MADGRLPDLPLGSLQQPLRLRSRLLGEEVWIVPDDLAEPWPEGVCYRVSECRALLALGVGADAVRAVHALKKALDGVLDLEPPEEETRRQ